MQKDIYVVGIIPEEARKDIVIYQRKLSELYDIYGQDYPELHITLAKLYYENISQIEGFAEGLNKVLPYKKPVSIKLKGVSCFGPPFKSVNFHVTSTPGLVDLSKIIIAEGVKSGLVYKDEFDKWQYHISIANPAFAKKEWTDAEFSEACSLVKSESLSQHFLLNRVEVWHPVKESYSAASFILGSCLP